MPEPPFNTDGNVIFRYHFDAPDREVLLYHKFLLYMEGTPESALKIIDGCWGKIWTCDLQAVSLTFSYKISRNFEISEIQPTRFQDLSVIMGITLRHRLNV